MKKNFFFILVLLRLSVQTSFSSDKPAGVIDFPNVPEIPVPEGMGYNNYFKQHQPVKLVFGVSDPGAQLKESLTWG